jgi:putative transposase
MSRPLRVEFPGAIYHVMARGVARMRAFDDDDDYTEFLRLTGELVRDGAWLVHSFCLMPTHPHLLVETPYGGLGRWMRSLLADYARFYNRRHERSGHLFQARYKAILVEDGQYLLECSRYIHLNPNRKKLTRPAELWPWSSYRNYVRGPRAVDWVTTQRVMAHFERPADYRAYVESGRGEAPISPFERATAGLVLGSPAFVERIQALEKAMRPTREVSGRRALRQSAQSAPYELIRSAVDTRFATLSKCKRTQVLAFALYRLTWLKTVEIAQLLDRSPAAVCMARQRIQRWVARDESFAADWKMVEEEIHRQAGAPSPESCAGITPAWYREALSRFPLAPIKRKA